MTSSSHGQTLYLIPNALGGEAREFTLPYWNREIIRDLDTFIIENLRNARRFLKKIDPGANIDLFTFFILDEHTEALEAIQYLESVPAGKNIGLLSEAGTPCIADPGALIVARAHQMGIKVVPLVGPNSIIMALMASGFNGQKFTFHGYLPINASARDRKIREMEKESRQLDQTQIFIETPYRNMALLQALLKNCQNDTALCIACNLTLPDEFIRTRTLAEWKKEVPDLHKKPAVFLMYHQISFYRQKMK